MTDPRPSDPTASLVSVARYERASDGRSVRREFPLAELAVTLEEALAQAQRAEAAIEND